MPDFGLVEPFDIDAGELDGLRPQVVFCLGYEWCEVSALLAAGGPIRRTILAENAGRVKRMCIRRGRKVRVTATEYPEWAYLDVADEAGEFAEVE